MKFSVDRLTETPTPLSLQGGAEWWAERGGDPAIGAALTAPVELELTLHRMGEDVFLEGEARGEFALSCSRCLTRYRQPVRESVRLVLEPAGSRVPADPEGAAALARDGLVLSDELETGWFRGGEVHLDRFAAELIALAFPVQPLCQENCLGLCGQCGVDRNTISCECGEVRVRSPFAALEALKARMGEQGERDDRTEGDKE